MISEVRHPDGFWDHLERIVSDKVEHALRNRSVRREPVIEYLRHLEELARRDGERRQTVQIIASGRSLLGDRGALIAQGGSSQETGGRTGNGKRRPISLAVRA
jgi:hypothetical protein